MEFLPSIDKRLILILILLWADIGMTYVALDRYQSLNNENFQVEELSIMAGPAIEQFGLVQGLIIGGLINTIIILFIALLFRGPVEHGILMGIFILAVILNFRLWIYMGVYL